MGVRRGKRAPPDPADLNLIIQSFSKCRRQNGSLSTDHYLCAGNELFRLFQPLGRGFRQALGDVSRAIHILEIRRVSGAGSHCGSLDTLLEQEHGLVILENRSSKKRGNVEYGKQSVLTLYQGVEFMLNILSSLKEAHDHNRQLKVKEKTDIYHRTLGRNQSSLQQAAVRFTLTRSGGKHSLTHKLEPSCHGVAPLCVLLGRCLETALPVQQDIADLLGISDLAH